MVNGAGHGFVMSQQTQSGPVLLRTQAPGWDSDILVLLFHICPKEDNRLGTTFRGEVRTAVRISLRAVTERQDASLTPDIMSFPSFPEKMHDITRKAGVIAREC